MWRSQSQGMTLRRDVPTAWQSLAVDALAVQKKGAVKIGPFGSQLKKNELRNEGVRVYGQENVLQDDFRLGNRFIDDAKFDSLRSVQLFAGDVVVTMMGSVGAATVVPDGIPTGIMDSHLLRIQPNTSMIEPEFLAKVLRDSSEIKKQIRARSQGGIMSGLNARIVRSLEVPVPPLPEQRKIAAHPLLGGRRHREDPGGHRPGAGRQARPDAGASHAGPAGAAHAVPADGYRRDSGGLAN